jgi:hypothetical protein
MNEIEYAITNFEEFLEADIGQGDLHMCSAETALSALREKLERENGCEYCKVLTPDCCGGFFLPSIDPDCEADMVTITHCPMCGKRLEAQHEQN